MTSSSLLLAHAHFAFLFKEFLGAYSVLATPPALLRKVSSGFGSQADLDMAQQTPEIERIVSLDGAEDSSPSQLSEQASTQIAHNLSL